MVGNFEYRVIATISISYLNLQRPRLISDDALRLYNKMARSSIAHSKKRACCGADNMNSVNESNFFDGDAITKTKSRLFY